MSIEVVSPDGELPPLVPSRLFGGARMVVVGGTGFLGKVWLAMLLARFPEVGHLYLLVRPKADQTPDERFWTQIVTSPVFDPLRETHGAGFEAFIRERITPVAGDIVQPELGLDEALLAKLEAEGIAAVVNVAGVVDFNPPLDEALEVNAFGVNNLVSLARRLRAPVMHTSTCYVAGYRTGLIEEVDPRSVPFPKAAGEKVLGEYRPTQSLDRSHWDPQREIDECLDLVKQARMRCDDAFRQSAFLDEAKNNLRKNGEPTRGSPLEEELAKVKRRFIEARLVDAGLERARFWGWSNIYTYTKSIGEQVLAGSGVPYTIVRPAVIESSVEFPFPGWNEGINTSAPFIFMALKGQVQFPGGEGVHLDIIPVDMVAAGMIASLAELLEGRAAAVYQYGATDTNACLMRRYLELIGLYKRRQAFEGKRTRVFDYVSSFFEPRGLNKSQYDAHGAHAIAGAMQSLGGLLEKAAVGPAAAVLKPAGKALKGAAKTEHKTGDIMDLFVPFTAESDWVFSCANTRAAMDRMPPEERAKFFWAPEAIDWRTWMFEVHLPGLEKWVVPLIEERMSRDLKPLRTYDTLLDLLDEVGDRHEHAVALSQIERDGLSRITYQNLRDFSHAVAGRLAQAGVAPGDRVVLGGKNQPGWVIAYFGILRAGAAVVPVDPGLEAEPLANIVRKSGAKVAVWDDEIEQKGGFGTRKAHPGLVVLPLLDLTDVSDEEAGLAFRHPMHVRVEAGDVASIIYTSGTTGDPKGVLLSHKNFTSLLAALAPLFQLGPRDRVLSVLPLHHTFEFSCGLLLPLSQGARIIYLAELTSEGLKEGLTKGRITAMAGVPALWQLLERRILSEVREKGPVATTAFQWGLLLNRTVGAKTGVNLGRLLFGVVHDGLGGNMRHLISGGAALPKDTAKLFSGLGLPLSEGYGLTEAAPVLTVSKASMRSPAGQVGKAVPGVEIKISEPDDRGVGEVLARGPNVMLGYADDPAATERAIDAEGWLHTGDLGKLDKKNRLVIVGRDKDVIVGASGENVYPEDIETSIGTIAGVRELALVGVDDPRGGERVACLAVVEPYEGEGAEHPADRAERHDKALASLRRAFDKIPRAAQPLVTHLYESELPRTATRKVKRKEVRAILERLIAASTPTREEVQEGVTPVRHAVAALANRPVESLSSATSLRSDLGFDSMMQMELGVALEAQSGRPVDSARLNQCETIGDVERMMGEAAPDLAATAVAGRNEEPIVLPKPVADTAKRWMTKFQMGFYDRVMKPRVYGRAHIPHNRNAIVASNHASHLDMGFVKYALGSYGDSLVSLAAQDYFFEGNKWRRAYFENLTNLAAFDRKSGLRQGLRQAGDLIDRGHTVLLFPEGTRSTDGQVHEFKPAIGHLALTHGVDILPVYIRGTYEAMPKGSRVPLKREISAHIGVPLQVHDLRRLTEGMKASVACRKVAELAREAVIALKEGRVFDISKVASLSANGEAPRVEHPMVRLFRELESKFHPGAVKAPITYYFTLGSENEAKWTLFVDAERCVARQGKPDNDKADCVLKTSQEIFTKIVREAYTPSPMEFMTGAIKSNDVALLQTFQKVFDLA